MATTIKNKHEALLPQQIDYQRRIMTPQTIHQEINLKKTSSQHQLLFPQNQQMNFQNQDQNFQNKAFSFKKSHTQFAFLKNDTPNLQQQIMFKTQSCFNNQADQSRIGLSTAGCVSSTSLTSATAGFDRNLSKDQKLQLLKAKREQKEQKIKSKLDIYTSVRPQKDNKAKDKATQEYYAIMQRGRDQNQMKQQSITQYSKTTQPSAERSTQLQTFEDYYTKEGSQPATGGSRNISLSNPSQVNFNTKSLRNLSQKVSITQFSTQVTAKIASRASNSNNITIIKQSTPLNDSIKDNQENIFQSGLATPSKLELIKRKQISQRQSVHNSTRSSPVSVKSSYENHLNQVFQKTKQQLDRELKVFDTSDSENEDNEFDNSYEQNTISSPIKNQQINHNDLMMCDLEQIVVFRFVLSGDAPTLELYLQKQTSSTKRRQWVNGRDQNGRTPLFFSVVTNNYEICEILLRNGAETLYRDLNGRTALHFACMKSQDQNLVKLLIDYKNIQDRQNSHLKDAVHDKNKGKSFDQAPITIIKPDIFDGKALLSSRILQSKSHSKDYLPIDGGKQPDNCNKQLEKQQLDPEYCATEENYLLTNSQQNKKNFSRQSSFRKAHIKKNALEPCNETNNQNNEKRAQFEVQYKVTQQYKLCLYKYMNLPDKFGKTPLHYAAYFGDLNIIKLLINLGSNMYIRDYKQRKPENIASKELIKDYLSKEGIMFEDTYYQVMEDKKNKRQKLDITDMSMQQSCANFSTISIFERPSRQLNFGNIEKLSQYSNEKLSQFNFGIYQDNALTHMMRIDDQKKLEYLLRRGIMPSFTDSKGENAIHYAVRMQKLQYLKFLLEVKQEDHFNEESLLLSNNGDLESTQGQLLQTSISPSLYLLKSQRSFSKGLMNNTLAVKSRRDKIKSNLSRNNHQLYQLDALLCLDKCNLEEGLTPFTMAVSLGYIGIVKYLVEIIKQRAEMVSVLKSNIASSKKSIVSQQVSLSVTQALPAETMSTLKSLKDFLEYTDKANLTPLLLAAKNNHHEMVQLLMSEGADPYVQCQQLMNPLHYAVINSNECMIKILVYADAEGKILLNEKNARNMRPDQYDKDNKFGWIFNNVWELAATKNKQGLDKLNEVLELGLYKPNQQTSVGKNTPLHFAMLYNNPRAVRAIMQHAKYLEVDIQNADGITAKELALMHKNPADRVRLLMVLNKDFGLSKAFTQNMDQVKIDSDTSRRASVTVNLGINVFNFQKNKQPIIKQGTDLIPLSIVNNNSINSGTNNSPDSPKSPVSPRFIKDFSNQLAVQQNFEIQAIKNQESDSSPQTIATINVSPQRLTRLASDAYEENNQTIADNNASDYSIDKKIAQANISVNGTSQKQLRPSLIKPYDQTMVVSFIKRKQQEYENESRLGNFNPQIYLKNSEQKGQSGSSSGIATGLDSLAISKMPSGASGAASVNLGSLQLKQNASQRKTNVLDLFQQIDTKNKGYIELNQIEKCWDQFQQLFSETECENLKQCLNRYYKQTKITKPCFCKVLNFYLDE